MNPEYQNACFRATPPLNGWPCTFGIITACNPDGKIVSDQENAEATDQLCRELVAAKLEHFPVTGGSKDFTHAEPGFGVIFPSQEEAIAWGQRYEQEAIFWVHDDQISLVSCHGSMDSNLGSWQERIL